MEKEVLVEDALQTCQKSQYKKLGLIISEFTFYNTQMEAIHILFFKQKNLLLFAKTGFRKSLIFQLLLFFIIVSGIILTLMLLKLLQAKQIN